MGPGDLLRIRREGYFRGAVLPPSMKMPKPAPRALERFEALLPDHPEVSHRLVFGHPAAFVRGNMFFGVFGEALFVRLSESDRDELRRVPGARPFEPMPGRAMSGYMVLPEPLLSDSATAEEWVGRSLRWTASLPPKRPKSAGSKVPGPRPRARTRRGSA
jgi:TfoX/Sxy family transcriptional regulator of competence genes